MQPKPKILVGCPVSNYHEYCTDEYIDSVNNLTYDNYDVLLVDNSKDNSFYDKIKDRVPVIKTSYLENAYDRVIESRNILRQKALEGGYDYLLSLEQDVIPPRNVIEKLLSNCKQITTGIYFKPGMYENHREPIALVWVKSKNDQTKAVPVRSDIINGDNLIKVDLCGLGCVLISHNALEKIKFRYDLKDCPATDDIFFCKDAEKEGFEIYADTSIKCRHLLKGRDWHWEDLI